MLVDDLDTIKENIYFQTSGIKNLDDLIEALNDWPQSPSNLEEYLEQLKVFLRIDDFSLSEMKSAVKKINSKVYAWESESFASLYRFMYMNREKKIDDLFLEIETILIKCSRR